MLTIWGFLKEHSGHANARKMKRAHKIQRKHKPILCRRNTDFFAGIGVTEKWSMEALSRPIIPLSTAPLLQQRNPFHRYRFSALPLPAGFGKTQR
jgi:hypothetical protein